MNALWRATTSCLLICLLVGAAWTAGAQDATEFGILDDGTPEARYPVTLRAGYLLSGAANASRGNLDVSLRLLSPEGELVIANDDASIGVPDAAFSYLPPASGEYTLVVSRVGSTSGAYTLTIERGQRPTRLPRAAERIERGYLDDGSPLGVFPATLVVGEALVIRAEVISGDLDPNIVILNAQGAPVAINQHIDGNLDAGVALTYTPTATGDYTILVANLNRSAGDYRLHIQQMPAARATPTPRIAMSGPPESYDSERFRIHYTTSGRDASDPDYVRQVADTMEAIYETQVNRLGWPPPPPDGQIGGNDHYDVYLVDLLANEFSLGLGIAAQGYPFGDNPNTAPVEKYGGSGFIRLDNDYSEESYRIDPIDLMRASAAHEFHHIIQFGYDTGDVHDWYYEATASWMELVTFPESQDAARYVEAVFDFPEVCLGAAFSADPSGGDLMYGTWLFLESLAATHDRSLVVDLWANIAGDEGWAPLDRLLAAYDETLEDAALRYHLTNLVRDYQFTPLIGDYTLWLENTIDAPGTWSYTGEGVQELAANYYMLALDAGTYSARLISDNAALEMWLVEIKGEDAFASPLGAEGVFKAGGYDHTHLMVFNRAYDDSVGRCDYSAYEIVISSADGSAAAPMFTLDASQYRPLD